MMSRNCEGSIRGEWCFFGSYRFLGADVGYYSAHSMFTVLKAKFTQGVKGNGGVYFYCSS